MNFDLNNLTSQITRLAWLGLKTWATTFVLVLLGGILLAVASYFVLSEHPGIYSTVAVVVALFEAVMLGFVLGIKRGSVAVLVEALGTLKVGRGLVRLIFEKMLGITGTQGHGERGGQVARSLERLPLAQADDMLTRSVDKMAGEAEGGWTRQKVRARLLAAISTFTLARFRQEGTEHGGVDLLRMKEELERTVDEGLVRKLRAGLRLWLILAIIGLPVAVALQTWLILLLIHSK